MVSGQRCTAYSSCTSREYSARRQSQRAGLVAAADRALGQRLEQHLHALAALVARPAADDLDRLVEGLGVAQRWPTSASARRRSWELRLRCRQVSRKRRRSSPVGVEVEHRLGAAPVVGRHARAGERGPGVLLAPGQVLDGDPPQLALEDLRAPLRVGGHRQHAALDAQAAAAAAAHRADDDRAAAVDVAVEQRVQRDDRVVVAWSPGGRSRRRCRPPCPGGGG